MALRLRYSLFTLLILTALVAGAVKVWWIGPHHEVLRPQPDQEFEHTYRRELLGEPVLLGPEIYRLYNKSVPPKLLLIQIRYYRDGRPLALAYHFLTDVYPTIVSPMGLSPKLPAHDLTPDELSEFQAAVERERELFRSKAASAKSFEGYGKRLPPS